MSHNKQNKENKEQHVARLEAYDKDNDQYIALLEKQTKHKKRTITEFKDIGLNIWKNFHLTSASTSEPIDWLSISVDDENVAFLDTLDTESCTPCENDGTWKNYNN